jgi:hypothetical protein
VSDIDTATPVDGLKVLDPKRPIREADIAVGKIIHRNHQLGRLNLPDQPQFPQFRKGVQRNVLLFQKLGGP